MAKIVKRYKTAPAVRGLALTLVQNLPPKQWLAEVQAIFAFVRDDIRYVRDVRGCETLQSPVQTLRIRQGDCDDQSMLLAALLMSVGHPCRFIAVGFMGQSLSHVFVQTKVGEKWISLDATMEHWQPGRAPAGIKSKMIENI